MSMQLNEWKRTVNLSRKWMRRNPHIRNGLQVLRKRSHSLRNHLSRNRNVSMNLQKNSRNSSRIVFANRLNMGLLRHSLSPLN